MIVRPYFDLVFGDHSSTQESLVLGPHLEVDCTLWDMASGKVHLQGLVLAPDSVAVAEVDLKEKC